METAIRGRLTLSPNTVFNPKPGEKESLCKGPCINHGILMAISTTGPGILEKPVIERTTPGREYKFDLRKSRKISPPYLSYTGICCPSTDESYPWNDR